MVERVEAVDPAVLGNAEAMHQDAVLDAGAGWMVVGEGVVVDRTGREHLDPLAARCQLLSDRTAERLRATDDLAP